MLVEARLDPFRIEILRFRPARGARTMRPPRRRLLRPLTARRRPFERGISAPLDRSPEERFELAHVARVPVPQERPNELRRESDFPLRQERAQCVRLSGGGLARD